MDNTQTLLAALRRVRSFPAYSSFMAQNERLRIKRELQKRLLRVRRQRSLQRRALHVVQMQQHLIRGIFA